MGNEQERIENLAKKWRSGHISKDEIVEFETWYHSFDDSSRTVHHYHSEKTLSHSIYKKIQEKINSNLSPIARKSSITFSSRWIAAASISGIIFITCFLSYFLLTKSQSASLQTKLNTRKTDVMPGGNSAVLFTSDGKRYELGKETIKVTDPEQGELSATENKLMVNADERNETVAPKYHTLAVPSKGQFEVELPDGSHVWLNAASRLTFPDHFPKDKRQVFLSGEAYFEVKGNKNTAFEVITAAQTIEVLGTHFNVKAYNDEPKTITSLLEGKVRLVKGNNNVLLQPGQQGITSTKNTNNDQILLEKANVDQSISWKNGLFDFRDADVSSIMRAIARWYNVEVEYRGAKSNQKYSGKFYRHITLQESLSLLNYSGIKAKYVHDKSPGKEGKIIIYAGNTTE